MDNKFYYKTPAIMLMMFAGTTTAAYAAENEVNTPETNQNPDQKITDQTADQMNQTANQTKENTANTATAPINVIATNDLSHPQSITEQYSLTQVKNNTNVNIAEQSGSVQQKTTEVNTANTTTTTPAETATPQAATTVTEAVESVTAETNSAPTPVNSTVAPENKTIASKADASSTNEVAADTVNNAAIKTTNETPTNNSATVTQPVAQPVAQPDAQAKPAAQATATTKPVRQYKMIANKAKVRTLAKAAPVKAKNIDSMSVNEVIKYNNWAVPEYEKSFFDSPKIAYRNGVAKPEGIVAHETANPSSTIDGEVAYMKRNYNSAFVHAFIDDKRIVEVADTDYLSWGAGPVANPRFINVELVRVYGKEAFSRSINNYADYFATNLLYYGLPLDNAHYDGNGTVWNHKAVSNFLGGTDHTDPIGWFQANNYTFDDFYNLVSEKYNYKLNGTTPATPAPTPGNTPPKVTPAKGKVVTTNERRIAKVKQDSADIYTTVSNAPTSKAGNKANTAYYVNKKAVYNGETYYALLDNNNIPRGWVKAKDTSSNTLSAETATSERFIVNNKATNLYTTPWGTAKQVTASLKPQVGKEFVASKFVKVGTTPFYFGTVNALSGWVNVNDITKKTVAKPTPKPAGKVVTTAERRLAKIKLDSADIYSTVSNASTSKAGSKANTTFYVNKKAVFNGETYYALTDNNNIPRGWVKAKDTSSFGLSPETPVSQRFTVNSKATNLYATPWGTSKQITANLKPQVGKEFVASKYVKVGKTPYYFGTVNALTGWVNLNQLTLKSAAKAKAPVKITGIKNVKLIGRTDAKNVVLYPNIQSTKKATTKPVDMQVYIDREVKKNNEKYYSVADPKNKFLGWISDTFIKEKTFQTVSWTKAPYTVKKPTGYIYSIPGGSRSQRIKRLSALPTKTLQVIRTDKVGNTLWHKVLLDDKTVGYVSDNDVFSQHITRLKAPDTLAQAVAKQSRLKNPARNAGPKVIYSTQASAYNERLAEDNEIKAKMDTKNAMNDPELKYQFLDLGQSEGISAKQLNKILAGKGILENQGAAFAKAAKDFKINEVYLIAHALLETGHGTSRLANGLGISDDNSRIIDNAKKKYYNTYGTKATDNNVELGGISYAKQNGWDSVSKAIIGGAEYVRKAYIDRGQRTLHQMRWNPENTATHQYATDINWAVHNAKTIARLYKTLGLDGLNYIVHEYK